MFDLDQAIRAIRRGCFYPGRCRREFVDQGPRPSSARAVELSGPPGAATRLGINRSTLQFRMGKLGIRPSLELCMPVLIGRGAAAAAGV
jgi:hypothetical protein